VQSVGKIEEGVGGHDVMCWGVSVVHFQNPVDNPSNVVEVVVSALSPVGAKGLFLTGAGDFGVVVADIQVDVFDLIGVCFEPSCQEMALTCLGWGAPLNPCTVADGRVWIVVGETGQLPSGAALALSFAFVH
jgi:hypothetical protein